MKKHHLDILIEQEVKPPELTDDLIHLFDASISPSSGKWDKWEYKNGVINVYESINLNGENLTSIPVQFGKVKRSFSCERNKLTSLKGCPYEVGGNFACANNQLTSLEFMPTEIGGTIYCMHNPFILNNKLFADIAKIGRKKIAWIDNFMSSLCEQISIQFGITDKKVIDEIWQSYMNILEGKTNERT